MKIGIIGYGNMGQALLRGIVGNSFTNRRNILISDKDRKKLKLARLRFRVCTLNSNSELIKKCTVILLAIKPQDVNAIVNDAIPSLKKKLLISICAGITTKSLERRLGKVSVVRVMPNMPAQISQGISAVCLGRYATERDAKIARSIFSCIGEVVEIEEQLMNAVTAISGSGPAYFFYLVENLINAAEELGIPKHIAQRLVIRTALGSTMLMQQSKDNAKDLIKRVASKGGTTEAAFKVFKKNKIDKILVLACKAAAKRAKELEAKE